MLQVGDIPDPTIEVGRFARFRVGLRNNPDVMQVSCFINQPELIRAGLVREGVLSARFCTFRPQAFVSDAIHHSKKPTRIPMLPSVASAKHDRCFPGIHNRWDTLQRQS
jgi:hypothetical protein